MQTPGLRTYFLCEKKSVSYTGKWNTWERDAWKQKIPVINWGQAPVSHQGSGGEQKVLDSTSGPGNRSLPAAQFPRQTYGNQMDLVNICFQNQLMTGCREAHEILICWDVILSSPESTDTKSQRKWSPVQMNFAPQGENKQTNEQMNE